jgi:hypothetical protein
LWRQFAAAGIPDGTGDFGIMSFQSKVASVVQMHLGVRVVTLKASAPGTRKNGSLLAHTAKIGGCSVRKYPIEVTEMTRTTVRYIECLLSPFGGYITVAVP